MQKLEINGNKNLVISKEEEMVLTGSGTIELVVEPNVNTKVLLKDANLNINLTLKDYSNLSLVCLAYNESKNELNVNVDSNANFDYKFLSLSKSCEQLNINLNGYKASTNIEYLSLNKDCSSSFNQQVFHNAKETSSKVNNVGLALNNSHIDFKTIGKINKGMSKSNCNQLARGIIIGDKAYITSEPILKIDEFDVKANHGTAIGRMSDNELFYLMSRGLKKEEAYKLILFGLINPIISSIWAKEESQEFLDNLNKLI